MTPRNSRKIIYILPLLIGSALIAFLPLFCHNQVIAEEFHQLVPSNAGDPFGSIQLSDEEIYRGETLEYNVTVAAWGYPLELLNWSFNIENSTDGITWTNLTDITVPFDTKGESPVLNKTWYVDPAKVIAGDYRVVLWIKTDTTETWVYKNFRVLNNLPVFNSIYSEKSSIDRINTFNVTANVTDVEITNLAPGGQGDDNIFVKVYYRDTNGIVRNARARGLGNNNYSAAIEILNSYPIGTYNFWVGVQDYRPGMEPEEETLSDTFLVTVENQDPSFDIKAGILINDQNPSISGTNISIRMGDSINITIIASDPENSVHFVLINLQHDETGKWVNYTMNYHNFPHTIIIDSSDLNVGKWNIWITVIDDDGGITQPSAVPNIEITVETWSVAAPIVFLVIGIFIGIAIGMAVFSWRSRQKTLRQTAETPAKSESVSAAGEKKQKVTAQAEPEEIEEEEEKALPEEEEGESKTQMKRKIRRRIN